MSYRNPAGRGRTDANQTEIVAALERVGASVVDLHGVGKGCTDLLIGFRGENYLLEVKLPSVKKLRPKQERFRNEWNGRTPVVVRSVADALGALGVQV